MFNLNFRFLDSYYRRLPVVRDGRLVGQISRRDVLHAEHHLARFLKGRRSNLLAQRREPMLADIWHEGEGDLSPATQVSNFMDTTAQTIEENLDFLGVAQIFLTSNRRRLPVLRDGKLVGQISRRDLLLVMLDLLSEESEIARTGLFLSAVIEADENPLLRNAPRPAARPVHGSGPSHGNH